MTTLYLDRKSLEMRCPERRLQVRAGGELIQSYPLTLLERVVVARHVETDTGTLARLAAAGIAVIVLPGRHTPTVVSTLPGNDARRRLDQYAAWHDPERRGRLVYQLLRLKLRHQAHLLERWLRARPDQRLTLMRERANLDRLKRQLADTATDTARLRGLEGAAAAAVFRALQAVLPPSLGFAGRRRRPPPDPVNALLSLGYTLAAAQAAEAAIAAGLDPAIGYLHQPSHDRPSLALDLVEPLRPDVEYLVWELFRSRRLGADHFAQHQGGCRLNKTGRGIFYAAWEDRAAVQRRFLRRLVQALVVRLQEKDDAAQ